MEQIKRAREHGFIVPATLVTNDTPSVLAFVLRYQGTGVICKPLEEGRLAFDDPEQLFFTSRLDLTPEDALVDFGPEPYLFQEQIPKEYDLRVTVIGSRVFGTRIDSQETELGRTDWRAAGLEAFHRTEDFRRAFRKRALHFAAHTVFNFGAIDFGRTPSGEYVFFEINPNGQWAWIEQLTGQPMASTLADLLEGKQQHERRPRQLVEDPRLAADRTSAGRT